MSKTPNYNNPYDNFHAIDNIFDSWAGDFKRKLVSARGKLLLGLFGLTVACVGTQGLLKGCLPYHPARPALQTILYSAYAGTGIWLTELLRIRKQADRGWTTMNQIQIENREDFGTQLAQRAYMPYADGTGDGSLPPAELSDE